MRSAHTATLFDSPAPAQGRPEPPGLGTQTAPAPICALCHQESFGPAYVEQARKSGALLGKHTCGKGKA